MTAATRPSPIRANARARLAALRRVIRQVIGAPDYDTYLDHCRTAGHPPRLTQPEYVREFFERKGRAPRCC